MLKRFLMKIGERSVFISLQYIVGDVMEIDEDGLPQHDTWIDATLLVPPYAKGKIPSNYVVEYNPLSEYQLVIIKDLNSL